MPTQRLSDAFVRNVKLPDPSKGGPPQVAYIDTRKRGLALVLVVSYGGTKTFRVMTYRDGIDREGRKIRKPHTVKLGTYPDLTLKQAWKKAEDYHHNPQRYEEQAAVGSF